MTENALAIQKSDLLVPKSKYATDEALTTTSANSQYLPYIQLMASSSNLVKEGKQQMGHFVLFKGKNQTDLGTSFDCVCLSWRPRAMEYGESVISIFNTENPEFSRIKNKAEDRVQGFAYGLEFLLYLPDFDSLVLYFFGSLTARFEAPNMSAILTDQEQSEGYIVVNIKSDLTGKKNRYHVPVVSVSESALTRFTANDKLEAALNTFNEPKDSAIETVDEDERER